MITLVNADSLQIPLRDRSVHMIATSTPYWGLRDYGLGDDGLGLEKLHDCLGWARGENCGACYVCRMRLFAAECWRVLRDDGTFWLNLGDSYASSGKAGPVSDKANWHGGGAYDTLPLGRAPTSPGLKPKDLVGIPWRVALALQADGWWLRSDIIWAKSNPMPESVKDRPTKAHEYIFLLTKRERYFYDQDAVREPIADSTIGRGPVDFGGKKGRDYQPDENDPNFRNGNEQWGRTFDYTVSCSNGRNRRTVWNIATAPYPGAHFACWPPALVEPMIKAGTSERGCCPECGAQWERVTEKGAFVPMRWAPGHDKHDEGLITGPKSNTSAMVRGGVNKRITVEWRPTCSHTAAPIPCTVLDPCAGSGTTGQVARQLGRDAVLLDLSFVYLSEQAKSRLELDRLEAWEQGITAGHDNLEDLPIFANGSGNHRQ